MMAVAILVFSAAAFMQLFISYCRSLIAPSINQVLSPEVQEVTGISTAPSGEDFARVVQLLHLCPERPEEGSKVRIVGAYFSLLSAVRSTVARVVPTVQSWIDTERGQCAYFAAVTLDRRIAFSRQLAAQMNS
jgi:hypothetical protein